MVMLRNGRCSATNVNPNTGMRDRNIPGKLRQAFGHKDLGIYLSVTQGGWLHEGEKVVINPSIDSATQPSSSSSPTDTAELLICTACYYLFDPRLLDASWHTPQDFPESWRLRIAVQIVIPYVVQKSNRWAAAPPGRSGAPSGEACR